MGITHGVVICFKFSNFAYANTVFLLPYYICPLLLFALNLVTLLMQIQCSTGGEKVEVSCYLL